MIVIFIRTLILYILVIFGMRLMGKRQLGELQPSELVITILISNIATLPIEDTAVPLLAGAVPVLTLICFEVILSHLTMKSTRLRTIISGRPRIIIRDGEIDQNEMRSLRYSVDDLMEQLRSKDVFDLQEVELAVVETTGSLSIYKKAPYQTASVKDLPIKAVSSPVPAVVVSDGTIIHAGLAYCNLTEKQLHQIIKKEGQRLEDIFLMTCTCDHSPYIVPIKQPKHDPSKGGSL